MVSEPGRGGYWVKKGDRLGHVVIERVFEGGIVYQEGNQSREMKIDVKQAAQLAQLKSTASASDGWQSGVR